MALIRHGVKTAQNREPNFKTTLRYPISKILQWSRLEFENQMSMACMFNMAEVVWFEYEPIRVDDRDWIVFEVTGRNKVPLPDADTDPDAFVQQMKNALI